jgi:hypothetical protein
MHGAAVGLRLDPSCVLSLELLQHVLKHFVMSHAGDELCGGAAAPGC